MPKAVLMYGDSDENADWILSPEKRKEEIAIIEQVMNKFREEESKEPPKSEMGETPACSQGPLLRETQEGTADEALKAEGDRDSQVET